MPSFHKLLQKWKRDQESNTNRYNKIEKLQQTSADNSSSQNLETSPRTQNQLLIPQPSSAPLRKGQIGLELVCEAPSAAGSGDPDYPVDIVFVHGLNGDIQGTWTHRNGVFWPRDLLPHTLPGARIFSYGYDSRIFFSDSEAEHRDFAIALVDDLRLLKQTRGKAQPIIFVCHSLGGIVVKEALNVASEREYTQDVLKRTRGIVFLGTPHRGSATAGPAALFGNILSAVWDPVRFIVPKPRIQLVKDLERSSKVLFAVGDRFTGKTKSLEIASFYEKSQTSALRIIVVDEFSGVLGLENEKRRPLFVDHNEISRFESSQSGNYRAVAETIREMATSILGLDYELSGSERSFNHEEQQCLHDLNAVDIADIESQIESRLPSTLLWLSTDKTYEDWLSSKSKRLLWVTGYAGYGKTVLASYLCTRILEDALPKPLVCRFYCDSKISELCSVVVLMRSIIHQIATQRRKLMKTVLKEAGQTGKVLWNSFSQLWNLFVKIATWPKTGPVVLIIDGFDEIDSKARDLLLDRMIQLLKSEAGSSVKVVLTSQPYSSAVITLERCALQLALESRQELIGSDVNRFIQDRLRVLVRKKGWTERIMRRLTDVLENKADRSFLWVSFTLAFLEQSDILGPADLEMVLSRIPPDLAKLYDRFLEIILRRNSSTARRLLCMILSSYRPLHVDEIKMLLTINQSHTSIAEIRSTYVIEGVESIQMALGPLVKVHDSKFRLVHTTLKDHLSLRTGSNVEIDEMTGHFLLAERCIRFLLIEEVQYESTTSSSGDSFTQSPASPNKFESRQSIDWGSGYEESVLEALFSQAETKQPVTEPVPEGHELRDYASKFWALHLAKCNPSKDSSLHDLALEFYNRNFRDRDFDRSKIFMGERYEYPQFEDPLTMSCFYGHVHIAETLLNTISVNRMQIGSSIYWASSQGHARCLEALQPLMDSNIDESICQQFDGSALAAAAGNGHLDCLEFLLRTGLFDINKQSTKGSTPLSLAVMNSHDHVVDALLHKDLSLGLDLNKVDFGGWSALFYAVTANSSKLVRRLLQDKRTEPNQIDKKHRSAFSWACEYALPDVIIQFVINERVNLRNPYCRGPKGYTPLIYAVKTGEFGKVKALFKRFKGGSHQSMTECGVDISAQDDEGRNAISWAAQTRDIRILELLLEHGSAEACTQDKNGWMPLAWTLDPPGYIENAARLLQYYDREHINKPDHTGSSVLSTAIWWGSWEIARLLAAQKSIDVDSRSKSGQTALSYAAACGSLDLVKLLVETRHADHSIADNNGMIPLHWAQQRGHRHVVEYLEQVTNVRGGAAPEST